MSPLKIWHLKKSKFIVDRSSLRKIAFFLIDCLDALKLLTLDDDNGVFYKIALISVV
jgi:hypothetical protein